MSITGRHYALFLGNPALAGAITAPTCGGSVTNSEIIVTWSGVSGVQTSYTVQVFLDAAMTNLVYYSGIVASAVASHVIPAGALPNGITYYILVDWVEASGQSGETATPCSFTANYAPSVNVTDLTVRAEGGCHDATTLPVHILKWMQVVPGAGETFIEYDVLRRVGGDSAWTRLAIITTISIVTYTDYTARSGAVYQYAVVWQALKAGPVTLISTPQSPLPVGYVLFDYDWLHEVGNEGNQTVFDQAAATLTVHQDTAMVATWGRQQPIFQVGESFYHEVRLPGLERPNKDRRWLTLRSMVERQRTAAAVYCLRMGNSRELFFCTITGLSREIAQASYQPTLALIETYHSEAV